MLDVLILYLNGRAEYIGETLCFYQEFQLYNGFKTRPNVVLGNTQLFKPLVRHFQQNEIWKNFISLSADFLQNL